MKFGRSAHVAQAAAAFLYGLQSQLFSVEGARPLEVLGGKLGDDVSAG